MGTTHNKRIWARSGNITGSWHEIWHRSPLPHPWHRSVVANITTHGPLGTGCVALWYVQGNRGTYCLYVRTPQVRPAPAHYHIRVCGCGMALRAYHRVLAPPPRRCGSTTAAIPRRTSTCCARYHGMSTRSTTLAAVHTPGPTYRTGSPLLPCTVGMGTA